MYAYYAITGIIPRDGPKKASGAAQVKPGVASASGDAAPPASKGKRTFIDKVKAAAAVTITPLQILQMVLGSYAIFHTHSVCPDKESPVFTVFGGVMYISYLALFVDMFKGKIKMFFGGKSSPKSAKEAAGAKLE